MSENEYYSPGECIGDYTVLEELGRGGMGVVYLTQHRYLKKRFAVKVMPQQYSERPEFASLFQQEAQTLGTLRHPNIVEVHNFGMHEGSQYLVMDYIEGGTIEDYLKKCGGRMPPEEVCATMHAVMTGLQHAHNKNIIHRDLKPDNFLLDMDGTVKITDFGLAQLMDAELDALGNIVGRADRPTATMVELYADQLKNQQFTGGTEGYMAPEVNAGAAGDKRADYYAIGVIAYYLLTGEHPTGVYKPASTLVKGLDKRWDTFISRCLQTAPEDRYQSPEELITELDLLSRKPRTRAAIAGILTVALVSGMAVMLAVNNHQNKPAATILDPHEPTVEMAESETEAQAEDASTSTKNDSPEDTSVKAGEASDNSSDEDKKLAKEEPNPTRRRPLRNPSFENGLQHWDVLGIGEASVIKDPDSAHEGSQMARIMSFRQSGQGSLVSRFEVMPGERILATVWTRIESQNPLAQPGATLRLVAVGKNNNSIGHKHYSIQEAEDWTALSLDIKVPAREEWKHFNKPWDTLEHVELHLIMENEKPSIARVWFDDVKLVLLSPDDPDYDKPQKTQKPPSTPAKANEERRPLPTPINTEMEAAAQKGMQEAGAIEKNKPKPQEPLPPEKLPLPPDMAQLTLTVLNAQGREIPPGKYIFSLNSKEFEPLPNTNIYRFTANRQMRIRIEAPGHKMREYNVMVEGGLKEVFTCQLEKEEDQAHE